MNRQFPFADPALPWPLHAPDGFFSIPVAIVGYIISIAVIAYALRKTDKQLNERLVPLMGVMAAFIFAAQMINFPVAGGTSGHLVGGALASILLGPWPAVLVMTAVVALQALLFQDGGLVVLGVNLLNMAVLSCLVGYGLYRGLSPFGASPSGMLVRAFIAAWASVMVAAISAAIQLALSGTVPIEVALPAMAGVHALIGIGEGLITIGALTFIRAARRDLLTVAEAGA
jgi:cobalt/nickel transport system permease protein